MASKDMPPLDIGDVLDRKERTVILWLRDWHNRRLASIFTGHENNNNAGKLTEEQRGEVQQALQSPPSDSGLPKEFWDVPQLKQYVTANFGVVYEADQSYHFLLKFSNLSFKYPDTFDRRRDDAFVAQRMKAIKTEIRPLFHDDRWEIFTVDEVTHFALHPLSRAASASWMPGFTTSQSCLYMVVWSVRLLLCFRIQVSNESPMWFL